ncbi:MAG: 50S ribosomal protein L3 N(5)-glutamine methyltransferase [Planctomycetes bacterium]|nr:50S ribosomal protein L3 N(5)-glutamine methyltransferase [Planctomycetota bacterium]
MAGGEGPVTAADAGGHAALFAAARDELATAVDLIRFGASRFAAAGLFFGHGTDNAVDEAAVLVRHALHLDHDVPDVLLGARLVRPEVDAVLALLRRRIEERLPAPYLTGVAWFAGLEFVVDRRVLVPRSPIAELIEQHFEPFLDPGRVQRVLDIGTGSGCIAIACATAFPEAEVDAVDLSADALAVAAENVVRHGVEHRVMLHEGDLFAPLEGRYDLIVANPPYVDAAEIAAMPAEFRHEPRMALASGDDGLDCVRRLLDEAGDHLEPDGLLVVEVGASRPALEAARPDLPFTWIEFERGGDGVFVLDAAALAGG